MIGPEQFRFCVYLHSKPNGEPFYVGKGSKKRAKYMRRPNRGHSAIVRKHGAESILIELIPCASEEEAFLLESFAIAFFRTAGFDLCNASDGGEGPTGHRHSLETRYTISLHAMAQPFTKERCQNISAALKGRVGGMQGKKHSPETIEKMSRAHLARPTCGMRGKKHSLETRLLMSKRAFERSAR